ncbi:helix-turn-helix domain-containing protein [Bacillus sp. FSL K6-3431]|uniref:helix-turn-helix domain-containing protein n=1 Tax=Bacillus sp. FSL K6-3431 TaxID=2921500 RepID=UPI004046E817
MNQVRIKDLQLLLETTDYKIADIAEMTGFSSQSFFAQSFKRITSQTPSMYRKETRKNLDTIELNT